MASRRSYFDAATPPSPMTPKGGSGMTYAQNANTEEAPLAETRDQFRRRVTPSTNMPEPRPSTIQELLAMMNGGQ